MLCGEIDSRFHHITFSILYCSIVLGCDPIDPFICFSKMEQQKISYKYINS
jgi:hypothetical protein